MSPNDLPLLSITAGFTCTASNA